MIRRLTINLVVATLVYWVVSVFWQSGGLGVDAFLRALPGAIVFALIYGAIQVALVLFRGGNK